MSEFFIKGGFPALNDLIDVHMGWCNFCVGSIPHCEKASHCSLRNAVQELHQLPDLVRDAMAWRSCQGSISRVLEGFDKGVFVRSPFGDSDNGWGIRLVPYISALAVLRNSIPVQDATPTNAEPEAKAEHEAEQGAQISRPEPT
jgi:hypothetical protein